MQLTVYKNPLALRFIRCTTPIPGAAMNAGGAGWTLQQAIARCESERIERSFELFELRPQGIRPLGIAAHFELKRATERATQEAIETLCLKEIHAENTFRCIFKIRIGNITIGVSRTSHGYFCLIRGTLGSTPIAAYTAARGALSCVLKAWEEFQSIRFYRPEGPSLRNFSKAHLIFNENALKSLPFESEPRFTYRPEITPLQVGSAERSGKMIVYFY